MTEYIARGTNPKPNEVTAPVVSVKETTQESPKNNQSGEDKTTQGTTLYAATNLESWKTDKPHYFARDVGIYGSCFRRLDPDYYAWLRHKMNVAKKAADSGRLPSQAFETLRSRFNVIHAWAMKNVGEKALLDAVRSLNLRSYPPPVLDGLVGNARHLSGRAVPNKSPLLAPHYLFPKEGDWRFTRKVSAPAVAKVDAIRDQALSLGWSEAMLCQNRGRFRFPYGQEYGLVCFVDKMECIGEVTPQHIEIIGPSPGENRLRFYN